MNNEIKSLAARLQAAKEDFKKAETAFNAGDRASDAAMQDLAAAEERYRQAEASIDLDPYEGLKELERIRKEIEDLRQIVERVRVIKEAKARANRARYTDHLGDLNTARVDLVKAISADATADLDAKAIRQLKRGWVALMLTTNTRPPWFAYINSVLSAPDATEIGAILKDLEREFPTLADEAR